MKDLKKKSCCDIVNLNCKIQKKAGEGNIELMIEKFIDNKEISLDDFFRDVFRDVFRDDVSRDVNVKKYYEELYGCINNLSKEKKEKYCHKVLNQFLEWFRDNNFFLINEKAFEEFKEERTNKKDILTFLQDNQFSSYHIDENCFCLFISIYEASKQEFVQLCAKIPIPYMLSELFSYIANRDKNGFIKLFDIMLCGVDTRDSLEWNGSIAAPVYFDVLFSNQHARSIAEKYAKDLADSLQKRDDGIFLIYNYFKYILTNDRLFEQSQSLIGKIAENLDEETRQKIYYYECKNIENYGVTLHDVVVITFFSCTSSKNQIVQLLDRVLCIAQETSIKADGIPKSIHYILSKLYYDSDINCAIERWKQSWSKIMQTYYKSYFKYYSNTAVNFRKNRLFLLIIGLGLYDYLLSNGKSIEELKELENAIWDGFILFVQLDFDSGSGYIDGINYMLSLKISYIKDSGDNEKSIYREIYQDIDKFKPYPLVFIKILYHFHKRQKDILLNYKQYFIRNFDNFIHMLYVRTGRHMLRECKEIKQCLEE